MISKELEALLVAVRNGEIRDPDRCRKILFDADMVLEKSRAEFSRVDSLIFTSKWALSGYLEKGFSAQQAVA